MAGFVSAITTLQSTLVVGWWYIANGTWASDTATKGTITTGLSKVLAHSTHITSGTVSAQIKSQSNVTDGEVASNGDIGILLCANDLVGTWQALGVI